jgi:cytochrome c556
MKRLLSLTSIAAVAALAATLSAPAAAQFAKPEDAIKYRQSAFSLQGTHFGRLAGMANGRIPFDAKVAADNAAVLEVVSKLPWAAFGPGTDVGKTSALPDIWKETAKFNAGAEKMQAEVSKLAAAAKGGAITLDQLKAAVGATGATCKACHDAYKEK